MPLIRNLKTGFQKWILLNKEFPESLVAPTMSSLIMAYRNLNSCIISFEPQTNTISLINHIFKRSFWLYHTFLQQSAYFHPSFDSSMVHIWPAESLVLADYEVPKECVGCLAVIGSKYRRRLWWRPRRQMALGGPAVGGGITHVTLIEPFLFIIFYWMLRWDSVTWQRGRFFDSLLI